jgi:hypothetical protein
MVFACYGVAQLLTTIPNNSQQIPTIGANKYGVAWHGGAEQLDAG